MKKYAFHLQVDETFEAPVRGHAFLLRCMPGTYPFQRSYANRLNVRPFTALTYVSDVFGNEMYTGTIDKAHDKFSFSASGFVLAAKYLTHEPLDRLYLYPTRFTRADDAMLRLLASAGLPEDDWQRAEALCSLVSGLLTKTDNTESRTAADALSAGVGTPRDFAHLYLTLCRQAGLAARYVSGLAAGIDVFHAWVEVYCGGVWRALDPFTGCPVEDGYLKIAHGPDSDSCDPERSFHREQFTPASRTVQVSVTEHVILTRDTVPHA